MGGGDKGDHRTKGDSLENELFHVVSMRGTKGREAKGLQKKEKGSRLKMQ